MDIALTYKGGIRLTVESFFRTNFIHFDQWTY